MCLHFGSSNLAALPNPLWLPLLALQLSPQVGLCCYVLCQDDQRGINVFNMAFPQTLPGAPCVGLDPCGEEFEAITTVAAAFAWLGTSDDASRALCTALGSATPKIRDIVFTPGKDYADIIGQLVVTGNDVAARAPTPIEIGHCHHLRRICRLRLNLTANEDAPAGPALGTGARPLDLATQGQFGASQVGLLAAPGSQAVSTEPRLKLSVILDPTLDSELARMPQHVVRDLFTKYSMLRGAEPAEDVEPTIEQISAVNQVLRADLVPYADFALLGPYGRRLIGKSSYLSWIFQPDGTWSRREHPGPASFDNWWASFRVLRVIYLLLDVAPPEVLDNYGEMVRGFHATYGGQCWFIIYTADVRMRSEQFERLRRHVERDHQQATSRMLSSNFDPAKPWHSVFGMALADKIWWDENLHRPAMLYLTRIKSASESVADGTVQNMSGVDLSSARPRSRSTGRGSRTERRQEGGSRHSQGDSGAYTKAGQPLCGAFNSASGCHRKRCPDHHSCKKCRAGNHGAANCESGKVKLTENIQSRRNVPPPPAPHRGDSKRGGKGGGVNGRR